MPAVERTPQAVKDIRMEIKPFPQELAWQAIETFPLEPGRTVIDLTTPFRWANNTPEDIQAAQEAGFIAGSTLTYSYEGARKVLVPSNEIRLSRDSIYWTSEPGRDEIYQKEAATFRALSNSVLLGGKPSEIKYDLDRGGLQAFREDAQSKLQSGGYRITNMELWISSSRAGSCYNDSVDMRSGYQSYQYYPTSVPEAYLLIDRRDLEPYFGGKPNISKEEVALLTEWFKGFQTQIKPAPKR